MTQPASPKEVSGSLSSCDALQHTDRVTSLPGSPYHQLRHKRDEFSLQVNRVLTLVKELSSPSKPAAPRSRLARSTTTALPEEVVGTDGSDHLHKRAHSLPAALRSELPLDATVDTADSSADQYGSENQSPPGLPRVVAWCNPCFSSSPPKLEPDYQAAHWLRTQVHLDDLDKESPLLQHAQQHAESAAIQWRHPGAPAAERQPFVQRSSGTANRAAACDRQPANRVSIIGS
ncbi:hypothetical protein WJX72_012178 [[Myrmecia] bisecta]|uniref:Uncharacterized protein n=1 Tax=[Myrmecia] bisecta TaxID=41462 RepID=A0AAW1PTI1_9CHLO